MVTSLISSSSSGKSLWKSHSRQGFEKEKITFFQIVFTQISTNNVESTKSALLEFFPARIHSHWKLNYIFNSGPIWTWWTILNLFLLLPRARFLFSSHQVLNMLFIFQYHELFTLAVDLRLFLEPQSMQGFHKCLFESFPFIYLVSKMFSAMQQSDVHWKPILLS